ncbi:WG repeat-containing protein, partial [bacterium]|nr:WG repeat-containing protein [bacterium]
YEEVRYSMCSHEHSTSFKQNGKWGFLDENGNVVIPAEYDDVSEFDFGVAWARKGDRRFIIDRTAE